MKRHWLFLGLMMVAAYFPAAIPAHGQGQLSAEKFDWLDKETGFFTPSFKAAIHELVDSKEAIVEAKKEEKELNLKLPDLQKQADNADAKIAVLKQKLADYDHTDEADFVQLQQKMNDAKADPEEQRVMAQAYVWAYPASPHQADAQQYLQTAQKKLDDVAQAKKDAEAATATAQAQLLQKVQARSLSLTEWREFLQNKSQEEVLKYLGRPQTERTDSWIYPGEWTDDPTTHQKVGLQVNFNAARVMSVSEVANP
jgi:chromosome segregation ATPase